MGLLDRSGGVGEAAGAACRDQGADEVSVPGSGRRGQGKAEPEGFDHFHQVDEFRDIDRFAQIAIGSGGIAQINIMFGPGRGQHDHWNGCG